MVAVSGITVSKALPFWLRTIVKLPISACPDVRSVARICAGCVGTSTSAWMPTCASPALSVVTVSVCTSGEAGFWLRMPNEPYTTSEPTTFSEIGRIALLLENARYGGTPPETVNDAGDPGYTVCDGGNTVITAGVGVTLPGPLTEPPPPPQAVSDRSPASASSANAGRSQAVVSNLAMF